MANFLFNDITNFPNFLKGWKLDNLLVSIYIMNCFPINQLDIDDLHIDVSIGMMVQLVFMRSYMLVFSYGLHFINYIVK